MVKVQAIIDFNYAKYDKIKNLESINKVVENKIFAGDTFDVENSEALYLTGKNKNNIVAVKVLEVIPEKTKGKAIKASQAKRSK